MLDFRGRVVLVCGAAGSVGGAVSEILAGLGARLALADRDGQGVEARAAALGAAAFPGVDARRQDDVEALAAGVFRTFGRIDALANTIGGFGLRPLEEEDAAGFAEMMERNALSALLLSRAVLPAMARQGYGRIVHIGAGAGKRAFAGAAAYAASKAALARISEAIAEEYKGKGITANVIAPGTLLTAANRAAMPDADFATWTTPQEIAALCAFLLSEEASGVSGAIIPAAARL